METFVPNDEHPTWFGSFAAGGYWALEEGVSNAPAVRCYQQFVGNPGEAADFTCFGLWVCQLLATGLILGGAIGNIIDRLLYGAVVDFVRWHAYGYSWPVFNVADAAITLGVGLLIAESLFGGRTPPKSAVE